MPPAHAADDLPIDANFRPRDPLEDYPHIGRLGADLGTATLTRR